MFASLLCLFFMSTLYGCHGVGSHNNADMNVSIVMCSGSFNSKRVRITCVFTVQCTLVQSVVLRLHDVCPSVCNVGGSGSRGWKSRKLIARTLSLTPSLFIGPSTYSHVNMGKFLGD